MSSTNTAQDALEVTSPMNLLRLAYRSIDIKIKSRHGRNFLKKRLIETWRSARNEKNEQKQRMILERAGSFLQTLHMEETHRQNQKVVFQLSRVEAQKLKDAEKAAASGFITGGKAKANKAATSNK